MKKIFSLLLFFCYTSLFAAPFSHLVFLGDSLTDNGNLYKLILKLLPKSPPYYEGRFSNGPTWAEEVSRFYYNQSYMDSTNYAVGGATAIFHLPKSNFVAPSNLELEVDKYLLDTAFTDRSQTLFSVWIGGNDYLFDEDTDPEIATTNVVNKISLEVERLISYGGKYFMVFNLPDLSRIPFATDGLQSRLKLLTDFHNEKLAIAIKHIVDTYPDVTVIFVNIYDIFTDVMTDPVKYNKKYNLNITNVHEACWSGGYWLNQAIFKKGLENELRRALTDKNGNLPKNIDLNAMSQFILNSPAIAETYKVGKLYQQGLMPCNTPDEHMFWDHVHPTAIIHSILAKIVLELLTAQLS